MSLNGNVKWFNSKKGYGFVTVITPESDLVGTDVFAHYTNVNVSDNNYKRLFPGEYVSFNIGKNNDRDVCIDIRGINGGRLLADHLEYRYKYFPKGNLNESREEVPDEDGEDDQGGPDQGEQDPDQGEQDPEVVS